MNLDTVAKHFVIAAIWADCPEGTQPRATRKALADAREYAAAFERAFPELCKAAMECEEYGSHHDAGSPEAAFGHDLFLTSAGHGAGFFSRTELGDLGERLSDALHWQTWHVETEFYRGWLYLNLRMPK